MFQDNNKTTFALFRAWQVAKRLGAIALFGALAQEGVAATPSQAEIVAKVGSHEITLQEYAMALRTEARRRFFHAKPPEDVLAAFRREVAEQLIDRALAVQEAKRRGIRLDKAAIDAEIRKVQQRGASQTAPEHDNKVFWEALRKEIEQVQLLGRLKKQINSKVLASDPQIRAYYQKYPEKFTEPERARVSVILLRVEPSAPQATWDAAKREAEQIFNRIKSGADFAELARMHSSDASASRGGEMGYVHKGMLAANVEQALASLSEGGVTEPITVLEGSALFKFHDRKPARLISFDEAKVRATDMWRKEEEARAWRTLIDGLRARTTIKLEERYLLSPS